MARREWFTGLWRNADFMKLWSGQTISQLGTYVTWTALPFTTALTLHATPTQMGILAFANGVPTLLGLFAGVWVDRLRRRPLMLLTDALRFGLLLTIPIAAFAGVLRIELCYAVAFLSGIGTLFFDVAYQSYFPAVVGRDQLVDGNTRLQATQAGASIIGPSLAGLLVQLLTAPFALIADACSYLVSVGFLLAIRTPEPAPATHTMRRDFRGEVAAGWRALTREPLLRAIVYYAATSSFFTTMRFTLLVLFATRDLGIGPALYGAANGIGGVGFLVGALVAGRIAQRRGPGPTIIGATAVAGMSLLFIPLASGPVVIAAGMLLLAQAGSSGAMAVFTVNQAVLQQLMIPNHLMGRTRATWRFITWGTGPFGGLLAGALGGAIGLRETLLVAVAGQAAGVAWLWASPLRHLRTQPTLTEPITDQLSA